MDPAERPLLPLCRGTVATPVEVFERSAGHGGPVTLSGPAVLVHGED